MNETNQLIIKLMLHNKSINEIAKLVKLTPKQVFQRIRQIQMQGYSFDEKYFCDGEIRYTSRREPIDLEQDFSLYTYKDFNNFKAVLISDIHFCSVAEALPALHMIYDYCIDKDIHIIFNTGDLVDGTFGRREKTITDEKKQAEYLVKNYPFDKSILNVAILGDHDFSLLRKRGFDLMVYLQNHRHDIIPLGYSNGTINIKNDSIKLIHPIRYKDKRVTYENASTITCVGHQHRTAINHRHNKLVINVTSLSQILRDGIDLLPGALALNITFRHGVFDFITIKQLMVGTKIYETSSTIIELRTEEETNALKKEKIQLETPFVMKKIQ